MWAISAMGGCFSASVPAMRAMMLPKLSVRQETPISVRASRTAAATPCS